MTLVDVGLCGLGLTVVAGGFASLKWLVSRLDRRFDKIDQRFDKVDQQFDKVDQRFAQFAVHVDWRLAEQGIVLGSAIGALAMEMDRGFRATDARIDRMEDRIDGRMDRMEGRMDRMAGEIAGLRTDLSEHLAHHAA